MSTKAAQRQALTEIVQASTCLMPVLRCLRDWNLQDCWLVSGAVYGSVWNHLTGRPETYGLNDIDILYFDRDSNWEAEDRVIREGSRLFPPTPPVQIRNQARVHLWFPDRFGFRYPLLHRTKDAIALFAARAHCVGVRLTERLEICAPFGLDEMFAMHVCPNTALPNAATYSTKTGRQKALWPELTVEAWLTVVGAQV